VAGGEKNYAKIQKLFDDQKIKEKDIKEKFKVEVKAEVAKLVGKGVPVAFSDNLKNSDMLFYNVSDVKIVEDKGEPKVSLTITAKEDFTIPPMKAYDYSIYYRMKGGDGIIKESASVIIPISLAREAKSFKKDDMLNQSSIEFNFGRYAADLATFSGIEFITQEEYNAGS